MKKLLSIILSITMLFSMATVAFADEAVATGAKEVEGIIKVGVDPTFKPFEYKENDKLVGFDIDLMNYIGARIDYGVEFVEMSFDKLIPSVISGEVDCAISAITITKERGGVVDFTRPYLEANVTYKDGEQTLEQYAVVFSGNSINKARLIEASGDPFHSKYMLVDNAVLTLKKDGTILKLIEKYGLNSGNYDGEDYNTTYSSTVTIEDTQSGGRVADGVLVENIDKDIPRYESWEEIGLVNPNPSEWAAKDIDLAQAVGITEQGKDYIYQSNITREEFCELIYNFYRRYADEIEVVNAGPAFFDTDNQSVLVLHALGIINGKADRIFAPSDLLTREEAATILVRMINKVMPGMPVTEKYVEYTDNAEISDWAMDSIQTVSNMGGVMNGVGNGRFAPKDNFTTEQAIVTLVRVLESAGAAGVLDENTSIGIIGGADGPTSIFISEEPSVIGGTDAPTEIYIADDVEVDDFYIDEALGLAKNAGTLASDATFVSMYATEGEVKDAIENIGKVDYSKPVEMYYISFNPDKTIEYYKQMLEATGEEAEIDFEKVLSYNRFNLTYFANMMNARYGAKSVAAAAILSNYKGYVMPKDFKNDFAIYLKYDSDFSVLVAFSEIGEGVIEARLQLVKNGEENDILSFMGELYDALGKDSVTVAKIKQ